MRADSVKIFFRNLRPHTKYLSISRQVHKHISPKVSILTMIFNDQPGGIIMVSDDLPHHGYLWSTQLNVKWDTHASAASRRASALSRSTSVTASLRAAYVHMEMIGLISLCTVNKCLVHLRMLMFFKIKGRNHACYVIKEMYSCLQCCPHTLK